MLYIYIYTIYSNHNPVWDSSIKQPIVPSRVLTFLVHLYDHRLSHFLVSNFDHAATVAVLLSNDAIYIYIYIIVVLFEIILCLLH